MLPFAETANTGKMLLVGGYIDAIYSTTHTTTEVVKGLEYPEFMSLRRNWVPPTLSSAREFVPPPTWVLRGVPHSLAGEGVGDPVSTKGQTLRYSMCTGKVILYDCSLHHWNILYSAKHVLLLILVAVTFCHNYNATMKGNQ
jgi:hypothetical protein